MTQPKRIYAVLIPTMIVAFLISSIGSDKTPSDGFQYWVGATGWFSFCVALLATLAFTVFVAARALRQRRAVSQAVASTRR